MRQYVLPFLLVLLFVHPMLISAKPITSDVAVPLSSKQILMFDHPKVVVSSTPSQHHRSASPSMHGGTYRPMQTVSSATVHSWNAGSLQHAAIGSNQVVSVGQRDIQPTSFSISQVGSPLRRVARGSSLLEEELTRTKRRAYGTTWEEGDTRYNEENGYWEIWDGEEWVETDPPSEPIMPVGDVPFLLLVALLALYVVRRQRRRGERARRLRKA